MHPESHPHGLVHDLARMAQLAERRRALRWLSLGAAAGATPWMLASCGGGDDVTTATTTGSTTTTTTGATTTSSGTTTTTTPATCASTPAETAGPYPGDGTNSNSSGLVNVLTQTGIVRSDIRTSVNGMTGTAAGVPLTVTLQLVNINASCAPLNGYALYLWHCTRDGNYSLYSSGHTDQNYLRGVQTSDANGQVSFSTIFPGCYSGRWPHIHFEIYRSLAVATSGNNDILTSQLALPADVCSTVYANATGYSASVGNLQRITLASDNVFGNDSGAVQIASVSGDATFGYTATIVVGIAA